MSLLATHLEQIELCAATISELPFPMPGIFTNAILNLPDITALIRDPDTHENALFSVLPAEDLGGAKDTNDAKARRTTVFDQPERGINTSTDFSVPRRHTAVTAVLGTDMAERIRRQRTGEMPWSRRRTGAPKDEVDIELLLKGAEKLCKAYPLPGVLDRIAALRARHEKITASIAQYERSTADQSEQLRKMSRSTSFAADDMDDEQHEGRASTVGAQRLTQDDLKREEDLVKELERRKKVLEERVDGMKKDIGGILR